MALVCLLPGLLLAACGRDDPAPTETPDPHAGMVAVSDGAGGVMWVPLYEQLPKNELSAGDFFEQDGILRYAGAECTALWGVDVSYYQGEIDWQAAADFGVEFAIIRLGYRGYSQGSLFEDERFRENMEGAAAAGIPTGVYFFSQAVSPEEAREEADYVLERLAGYTVSLPVIFDWENIGGGSAARTDGVDGETVTECALAFCERVRAHGYDSGVYFYRRLGYYEYDLERLSGLTLWVSAPGAVPDFYYRHALWQYSFSGRVDGIDADTDLNLYFLFPEPEEA